MEGTIILDKRNESHRDRSSCRGCSETVHVSSDKLEKIIEIATRGRNTVSDEVYALRMELCAKCEGLQYGTTCRYCGCLVAVRAWLEDSDCPNPIESSWNIQ